MTNPSLAHRDDVAEAPPTPSASRADPQVDLDTPEDGDHRAAIEGHQANYEKPWEAPKPLCPR